MAVIDDEEGEQMLLLRGESVRFSKASGKSKAFEHLFHTG